MAGHLGRKKTTELMQRKYWWPSIYSDITAYIQGCDTCQCTKALRTAHKKSLVPHDVPEVPWQTVSVDLIGELPESNGYNAICVVVDKFSKQIHAIPTTTRVTAQGMA